MRPVYLFILSFIIGVALYSLEDVGFFPIYTGVILSFALGVLYVFLRKKIIFLIAIVIFASVLGGARLNIEERNTTNAVLDSLVESEVFVEGIIIKEPDKRERSTRLTVLIETIEGKELRESPRLITSVDRFPEFYYGDRIELIGVLEKPENFSSGNGREFDYINYLAKDNIHYTMFFPDVRLLEGGFGNPVKQVLFKMKQSWLRSVQSLIPDPHVSLLGGLVVGAKQSLGNELEDDFRRTGIIHIVVLSGYNVTTL